MLRLVTPVLLLLAFAQGSPPQSRVKAPKQPETPNACPVTGCPGGGCGPPQACTMTDGSNCSGTRRLCDGDWTECALTTTSKRSCNECGFTGTQTCNTNGTFGECVSSGRQCSCGGNAGTRYCSTSGTWGECFTTAACGTQWCGNIGQYRCRVDGTQYCKMPDGMVPAEPCITLCGTPGLVACIGGDGLCRGQEVCNNCDDNLDGRIDEGVTRSCANRCGDPGTQQCAAGAWGACSRAERTEVCDGQDNNCDGQIDEGDVCRQDVGCQ